MTVILLLSNLIVLLIVETGTDIIYNRYCELLNVLIFFKVFSNGSRQSREHVFDQVQIWVSWWYSQN